MLLRGRGRRGALARQAPWLPSRRLFGILAFAGAVWWSLGAFEIVASAKGLLQTATSLFSVMPTSREEDEWNVCF